jgi:hypothetical protein
MSYWPVEVKKDDRAAMTKLASMLLVVVVGLAALSAAGPTLIRIIGALVPLVLVVGVVIAVLRLVWFYTR